MRYIIVNADDFGLSPSVNKGIIEAHRNGIVTSTTVMMNMPYAYEAIQYRKAFPNLGFGVHLVLTQGMALGKDYQTLTYENGIFKEENIRQRSFDIDEVIQEWTLQIDAFYEMGIKPTHLDSHQSIHRFEELQSACLTIQDKYKLPFRNHFQYWHPKLKVKSAFFNKFYKEKLSLTTLISAINRINDGQVLEIMCHPGLNDEDLKALSPYADERQIELDLLCSLELKKQLSDLNVRLVNYSDIFEVKNPDLSVRKLLKYLKNSLKS